MLVAIHQPNYLPWLGYFVKIANSDCFVFLDNVPFSNSGRSYVSRVQVKDADEPRWLTVPLDRKVSDNQPICCVQMSLDSGQHQWRKVHLAKIGAWYRKTPYFKTVFAWLEESLMHNGNFLADMNIQIIRDLTTRLGIDGDFKRASELYPEGHKNDLLINLVRRVGGDAYLRGVGAADYQDDLLFRESGITPYAQRFTHPRYTQFGAIFIPGLSIVDALMNCGFEQTALMIRQAANSLQPDAD